jgi:hypothetical protein
VLSLARCLEPSHTFSRRPAAAFVATTAWFGSMGAFLALQPLTYIWLGAGVQFRWVDPPSEIGYFVPHALAITLAFALLPALLLATLGGWSLVRRGAGFLVVLTVILALEGWVAPAAMYAKNRDFIERLPEPFRASSVRQYADTADVIRLTQHDDAGVRREAWAELQRETEIVVMAIAFALLGAAVGRARANVGAGIAAVTLWWLAAWILYQALHYWSQFLVVLSLPGAWTPWVTPSTCIGIALAAIWWMNWIGADTPDPQTPSA